MSKEKNHKITASCPQKRSRFVDIQTEKGEKRPWLENKKESNYLI